MAATFVWVTSSPTVWPTHGRLRCKKIAIHQVKLWCAALGLNQSVIGAAPYPRPKLFVCADSMSVPETDKTLTRQAWSSEYALIRQQAMDRARRRMERLGSGSPELFDREGRDG
jgi:hypothetical protein